MKAFAKNLREYRKMGDLSQRQTASFLGIPIRRYQSYEEGRSCPQLEDYVEIVRKLSITDPIAFIADPMYFTRGEKKVFSGLSPLELKYKKLTGTTKKAVDLLLEIN